MIKQIPGGITAPTGFLATGISCGLKPSGRKDLALIFAKKEAVAAGVFTTNKLAAAPVQLSKSHLANGVAQAIIVNSGSANACTGQKGLEQAREMAKLTASALAIKPSNVLVASTGIIGVPLPLAKIKQGIRKAAALLSKGSSGAVAEAIMTTDTFPKERAVEFKIKNRKYRIGGVAKGSGMIAPNMATMLAFLTTDCPVRQSDLQSVLKSAVAQTFNAITIDGETSTNDMVLVLARNERGSDIKKAFYNDRLKAFNEAFLFICRELALQIVKDGEGATKLIEVRVEGAKNRSEAQEVAFAIANSMLVKTAFYGEDANWGRIMAAIGHTKAFIKPDAIDISISGNQVARGGQAQIFCAEALKQTLAQKEIKLVVNLNVGEGRATVWTTDLSYEYVRINAEYTT
jgi:glutamate N-acetyltransferase/amino-acid N-acetyltransferase